MTTNPNDSPSVISTAQEPETLSDPPPPNDIVASIKRWHQEALADPRSTDELIALALVHYEDEHELDSFASSEEVLRNRGGAEVFAAAVRLHDGPRIRERCLGVTLLGEHYPHWHEFHEASVLLLLNLLEREQQPCVLSTIGYAFGQLDDRRAVQPLARLKDHPSRGVRWGVMQGVSSIGNLEDPLALATLMALSADEDDDIRNWSTFEFGWQSAADTPELREALVGLLDDPDSEVRGEALRGLAKRHDPRVIDPLLRALSDAHDVEYDGSLDAAIALTAPRLHPALVALHEKWSTDPDVWELAKRKLDEAIAACRPQ